MKTNQCDAQRIDEFLQSDSIWIESDLAAHLETCKACRDYMFAQTAEPDQWTEARELLRPTEFDLAGTAEFSVGGNVDAPASSRPIQAVLELLAPSDEPHRLGRLGSYEISGVVGAGGMGVVLKAIDPSLDRVVALKVLAPHLANNETARRRFAREAKAAAAVLHPNVIPIHSVASDRSVPYLVMAYVRGGSLQTRLEENGPLPLVEILRIGSQIAAGLAAAHDQGLVHRDIKPENILMEEGVERVTITDFGLARAVDDTTVTKHGTIAGTPMYMSPEQAAGKKVDQQSDLFSLGSVLYALCTGRPPYCGDSSYGVMRQIIDETPTPIAEWNPEIPDWLVGVIKKLMAKEKSDRYTTASEVRDLLERCLSHVQQPTTNPLPSKLPKSPPTPVRKSKMRALIAGSALFMVVLTAFASQWIRSQSGLAQSKNEVHLPLGRLDSYIGSMMMSPHETVFLNLDSIGRDDNYIVLQPIEGGVTVGFPAMATDAWSRRQGKYADRLKVVAQSMSLKLEETSEIADDGTIKGVTFQIPVTGGSRSVADTVETIIARTFDVGYSEVCQFQYSNMPSLSHRPGEQPVTFSSDEFIDDVLSGKRVYLGESEHLIYAIVPEHVDDESPYWNSTISRTDVRQLPSDILDRIRQHYVTSVRPNVKVASYSDDSRNGGAHRWQLLTQKVAAVRIRLMHISSGEMQVASENILRCSDASEPTEINLQLNMRQSKDQPKMISPSLAVSADGLQIGRNSGTPITVSGPSKASPTITAGDLAWDEPSMLFHRAVWDGDLSYRRNTESMIEASQSGADFVALEFEWVAMGEQSPPSWATLASETSTE